MANALFIGDDKINVGNNGEYVLDVNLSPLYLTIALPPTLYFVFYQGGFYLVVEGEITDAIPSVIIIIFVSIGYITPLLGIQ